MKDFIEEVILNFQILWRIIFTGSLPRYLKFKTLLLFKKSPTLKLPIFYNEKILRDSGIFLAGTNSYTREIFIDHIFKQLHPMAQLYALLHEEGHIKYQHDPGERKISEEIEADKYAMKYLGEYWTYSSMMAVICNIVSIEFSAACDYLVRLEDLGFDKARELKIIAPNGKEFNVDFIRESINKYGYDKIAEEGY